MAAMSEMLPPRTATGVTLQFVWPFDRATSRHATVCWRRKIGDRITDTWYSDIEQGGASVVLEQVTFPGDIWAVIGKDGGQLLALHTASSEREQRVVIDSASRLAAASCGTATVAAVSTPGSAAAAANSRRREIAAALLEASDPEAMAAKLLSGGTAPPAAAATAGPAEPGTTVEAACELSSRLCDAYRALARLRSLASGAAAQSSSQSEEACRLQIVLADGSRAVEVLPASARLSTVAARACLLLCGGRGLVWVADHLSKAAPTHALVCSAPRLRLPLHAANGLVTTRSAEDDATVREAQLTPSATLRLQELT